MGLGPNDNAVNSNDQSVVEVGVALPSGTNIIGKTGIDQTTDGTTNATAIRGQYRSSLTTTTANNYAPILLNKFGMIVMNKAVQYHVNEQRAFICTTDLINIGTSQTAFYLFRNPNASGKTALIFSIKITISGGGTYRIYQSPTVTSTGTGLNEQNLYLKSSPTSAVVTAFSQPTVSANGTLIQTGRLSSQKGTDELLVSDEYMIIDPNFDLLITIQNDANNTPTAITIKWIEV